MTTPTRITVVQTHPIQTMSPWFRHIASERRDLALTVLYASTPTPDQQGVGFGEPFRWDIGLTDGYTHQVLAEPAAHRRFDSESFAGADVGAVDEALLSSRPDAVVVPGWHSRFYLRAIAVCRRHGIPVLYRGDTNLAVAPEGIRRTAWNIRTRARLKLFDAYLSVGTASRDYLLRFGAPEPLIFDSPHCIDNAMFAATADAVRDGSRDRVRQELGAGPLDFLIVFAGKFIDRKRPLDVIEAAARLGGNVVVAMVGNGPLRDTLERAAARLDVRVAWRGFANQTAMPQVLAAADCVAVPSESESWGLVVNEALASGTPCVISSGVAAGHDLIHGRRSGAIYDRGDINGLVAALERVRDDARAGLLTAATCREAVSGFTHHRAADGLTRAAQRLMTRRRISESTKTADTRVLAVFGNMVSVFGLERMSFEVLRTLRERDAAVHCVVNRWQSSRVVDLADEIGASWSTGYYWYELRRRASIGRQLLAAWDVVRTSVDLLCDAYRLRPTHVFAPEFNAVLRSAPALWLLRRCGTRVVLRLGNPPEEGRFYRFVWRRLIDPCVDAYVANSGFTCRALLAHGIDPARTRVIYNTVPNRDQEWRTRHPVPGRVIYVGQVIPPKGVDMLVEAIARLRSDGLDATLDVVGDIDGWESPGYQGYRASIRARAAQPDLAGAIRFLGVREDVPDLLAAASVHCLPSRAEQKEGFGVVVLEAKRAGIPSVVTSGGAMPELIRHCTDGWICSDFTAEAIAEGLAYFLRAPDRAQQAGEAAAASERAFSRDRFADLWSRVFSEPAPLTPSTASVRPI
jgi:glycosyltransferase involved in cell wall biosynthesis